MTKKLIIFLTLLLIAISGSTQIYLLSIDSVKIPYKNLVSANQAFIELRNLKKINYVYDERLRNKDIAISYYEKLYKKCNQSDSITSILLVNKDKEIVIKDNLLSDYRFQLNKQKVKSVGLSIGLPLGIGLSFVGGFFLAKELFK